MTDTQSYQQIEQFFDGWEVYQKLLVHNYMYHREITAAVRQFLAATFTRPFTLLDLGCGDASAMVPVLSDPDIRVGHYTGLDMSQTALGLAAQNLAHLPCAQDFIKGNYASELAGLAVQVDVVYNSYSLHHLSHAEKAAYFATSAARLTPGGYHIVVDAVCPPNGGRAAYLDYFCNQVNVAFTELASGERAAMIEHVRLSDYPETSAELDRLASAAGLGSQITLFERDTFGAYVWQRTPDSLELM